MNDDIARILDRWAAEPDQSFALATVVRTSGSTYRKAGARMLISPEGVTTGMVSGGCLEKEVAQHGRKVLRQSKPVRLTYDTRRLMGCNGALELLVEPVLPVSAVRAGEGHLFAAAQDCLARRRCLVASTLFEAQSPLDEALGTFPLIAEDGTAFSTHGLPDHVRTDGGTLFRADRPVERSYPVAGGAASVLLHNVAPPIRLYVCGGGPDAVPVAALAAQLGWEVIVVTHPSQAPPELPTRCTLLESLPETAGPQIVPDSRTACVVMTHQYGRDLAWLAALLPLGLPYIGLLGPVQRCRGLLNDLMNDAGWSELPALDSLHSPVGLDIGADGPEEIALSIIGEIKAVLSGRSGGFLRHRQGAIHAGCETTSASAWKSAS